MSMDYEIKMESLDNSQWNDLHTGLLDSPRRNLSRSRSRSYEHSSRRGGNSNNNNNSSHRHNRSRSGSYKRSRSPRNSTSNKRSGNERSRRRQRATDTSRGAQRTSQRSSHEKLDRELGLKYRWEKTVYVSNIPYDCRWANLKDLFRDKVGDIMFCEVFEKDGRSQGVGAIEFKTEKDAERAVRVMHQYEMGGRRISVRIDGEGFKTRQAKELALEGSRNETSMNRSNKSDQAPLINSNTGTTSDLNQLVQSNLMSLLGMGAAAASSSSRAMDGTDQQQQATLNQMAAQLKVNGPVTNRIFVASLDYKVDERKLKEVFALAGNLISCEMFRDRDGKSRGMAVMEYDTPFAALNAVSMFNNQTLLDRQMTVRFDAKPAEKEEQSNPAPAASKLPSGLRSIGKSILQPANSTTEAIKSVLTAGHLQTGIGQLLGGLGMNLNSTAPSLMSENLMSTAKKMTHTQPLMGSTLNSGTSNNNNYNDNYHNNNTNGANQNNSDSSSRNGTAISKIFVKNIPFTWDSRKLKDKFRQAGSIEFAEIKQKNGQSRGCALIRYSTAQQANKAVELFNGSRFEGRTLDVNLDKMA